MWTDLFCFLSNYVFCFPHVAPSTVRSVFAVCKCTVWIDLKRKHTCRFDGIDSSTTWLLWFHNNATCFVLRQWSELRHWRLRVVEMFPLVSCFTSFTLLLQKIYNRALPSDVVVRSMIVCACVRVCACVVSPTPSHGSSRPSSRASVSSDMSELSDAGGVVPSSPGIEVQTTSRVDSKSAGGRTTTTVTYQTQVAQTRTVSTPTAARGSPAAMSSRLPKPSTPTAVVAQRTPTSSPAGTGTPSRPKKPGMSK